MAVSTCSNSPVNAGGLRYGMRQFNNFCQRLGISPMPASETTLSRFASFSARAVGAETIRVYLSAVRHFHIQEEYVDSLQTTPRLQFVLRSIWRSQKTSHNRPLRRPITLPVLRSLKTSLHLWPQLCRRDKLMYWPAFTTAFFGFMRVSQLQQQATRPSTSGHYAEKTFSLRRTW